MDDFLEKVENQLSCCTDSAAVMAELQDHVQTKTEFFEDIGYDGQASFEKANEAMGDGEITGQRLKALHLPDYRKINLISFVIAGCNIVIPFIAGIPAGNNTFTRPFFSAALMLIVNLLFTAYAIKVKCRQYSFLLTVFTLVTMHVSATKLVYPICNLLLTYSTQNTDGLYKFVRGILVIIILLILVYPNAYNIYYCRRTERLKNTKKQNEFTKKLTVFCVTFSVICGISACPLYYLNKSLNEKQTEIYNEFLDFTLGIEENFSCEDTAELKDYLNSCRYGFVLGDNTESRITEGNWQMTVGINETGYYISIKETVYNSSQAYIFNTYEKDDALIQYLGDDQYSGKTGAAVGSTKSEIHEKMKEINYCAYEYDCSSESTYCYYQWYDNSYLYGIFGYSCYYFYLDGDGICTDYELVLD